LIPQPLQAYDVAASAAYFAFVRLFSQPDFRFCLYELKREFLTIDEGINLKYGMAG
jgi:hypothetical protein